MFSSIRMIAQHITGLPSIKKQKKEAKTKQYVFFLYDNDHTNYIFTEFASLTVDNTVKRMKQEGMQFFRPHKQRTSTWE